MSFFFQLKNSCFQLLSTIKHFLHQLTPSCILNPLSQIKQHTFCLSFMRLLYSNLLERWDGSREKRGPSLLRTRRLLQLKRRSSLYPSDWWVRPRRACAGLATRAKQTRLGTFGRRTVDVSDRPTHKRNALKHWIIPIRGVMGNVPAACQWDRICRWYVAFLRVPSRRGTTSSCTPTGTDPCRATRSNAGCNEQSSNASVCGSSPTTGSTANTKRIFRHLYDDMIWYDSFWGMEKSAKTYVTIQELQQSTLAGPVRSH